MERKTVRRIRLRRCLRPAARALHTDPVSADCFRVPAGQATAEIKVERSRFLAYAFPIAAESDFAPAIETLTRKHFDATHLCWAWRLIAGDAPRARSSDAGEPSGTAGKPILNAIESSDLFDAAVVVVRYYGGVKLGTGGLSRAYRAAAQAAIAAASVVERYLYDRFVIEVPFSGLNTIYRLIAPPDVKLVSELFAEDNLFTIDVRRSHADVFAESLTGPRFAFRRLARD